MLGLARATDGAEALDVFLEVRVEHLAEHAALVLGRREAAEVIGGRLVHEALAVAGDLHKRLRAEVELLVGACERGHLAGAADDARVLARLHGAAVEDHRRADAVLLRARPYAGLDALAHVVRRTVLQRDAAVDHRVARAQHLGVARVAAGGEQHALRGVHLDVSAVGFEDGARHLAGVVLHQLYQLMVVGDIVALVVDIG